MSVALIVPVMKNFFGFTKLVQSINTPIIPVIINNWDDNKGVSPAWNEGLRRAIALNCEYAVIVNDDVVLPPNLITYLTPRLVDDTVVVSPQNITGVCHPRGLNFWCFAVRPAEFVERFGYFDEAFAPAYFEDDDMAYRIALGGGKIESIGLMAYHEVMGTQEMDETPVVSRDIWNRNEAYYTKKWGGEPGNERFVTPFGE